MLPLFPKEIVVVPVNRCKRVMKMLTSFKKKGENTIRARQKKTR
jgi:hypothetical protein